MKYSTVQKLFAFYTLLLLLIGCLGLLMPGSVQADPFVTNIPVSDGGTGNDLGFANTSRNIAITSDGTIYVVYSGSDGIRVASSTDRGATFGESVQVSSLTTSEPEITVAADGTLYVAFVSGGNAYISQSTDDGAIFSTPSLVGSVFHSSVHMATDPPYVYILEGNGNQVFVNSANGVGAFTSKAILNEVFADIYVDPATSEVIIVTDNPGLNYFVSIDNGNTFTEIPLNPGGSIYYSIGAVSFSASGRFWYSSGDGSNAYVIDLDTGNTTNLTFGTNYNFQGRQLAAFDCFVVDGFTVNSTSVGFRVSNDFGVTFAPPTTIPSNGGYISLTINPVTFDIVVAYSNNGQIFVDVYEDEFISCREIDVQGLGVSIESGDTTPDVVDDTNFGSMQIGNPVTHTFTITNTGSQNLNIGNIDLSGVNPDDFEITTLPEATIPPLGSTTFEVTFTPGTAGTARATVTIESDDADEGIFVFDIAGNGEEEPTIDPPVIVVQPEEREPRDNNDDSPAPQISLFDPAISKLGFLQSGETGLLGEQVNWIVTVSNPGNVAGQNIVVTDTLVDALQIDNVDAPGATVDIAGQTVSVSYSTLNPGDSVQFTITTTALEGTTVTNIACIGASNIVTEKCASGSVITQLPRTGESPTWREWLWLLLALPVSGLMFVSWRTMPARRV